MIFFKKLFLICTFKDPHLAVNLPNLGKSLYKIERGVHGVCFFPKIDFHVYYTILCYVMDIECTLYNLINNTILKFKYVIYCTMNNLLYLMIKMFNKCIVCKTVFTCLRSEYTFFLETLFLADFS